jgi:hypothetical protein
VILYCVVSYMYIDTDDRNLTCTVVVESGRCSYLMVRVSAEIGVESRESRANHFTCGPCFFETSGPMSVLCVFECFMPSSPLEQTKRNGAQMPR